MGNVEGVSEGPGDGMPGSTSVGRRTAVKGLAGGAVASLVWAEPTIRGLARRPAYARAGSGPSTTAPLTFEVLDPAVSDDTEIVLTSAVTDNGTPVVFLLFDGVPFGEPPGTLVLLAGADLVGCECGIADPGPTTAAEVDYIDAVSGLTVTVPGTYAFGSFMFALPAGAVPTRVAWTDLTVECA